MAADRATPMRFSARFGHCLPLLLITALVVLFYAPVLFQHKAQIHAEGVSLGVALMHMLSAAIHGESSALWTTSIYGGHPIFAEGQGGFANPLHLLLAWLLPAVPAYNLHQFISMLISGLGAYCMSRAANCSRSASAFAALALVFSTLWIGGLNNLAIGSTMGWIPWAFWGMQNWLKKADMFSACCFGLAMALMVVSGYPQLVHGVVIYMAVYLAARWLLGAEPMMRPPNRTRLVLTLVLAVFVCTGLSAVQWLPLLELAGESHRSEGVSIVFLDNSSSTAFLRGFLYTFNTPGDWPNVPADAAVVYFTAAGSLLVSLIVSMVVFVRRSPAVTAHLLATALLIVLGFGRSGTPLFQFLYDYHLVPGLHSFRVTFTYLWIGLVGFSLVGAMTLDRLAGVGSSGVTGEEVPSGKASTGGVAGFFSQRKRLLLLVGWAALWILVSYLLHVPEVDFAQYYLAGATLLCFGAALLLGQRKKLPLIAVLLLSLEILVLRVDTYNFGDSSLITKPESVAVLEAGNTLREFKVHDTTLAGTYSLYHPKSPEVANGLKAMLAAVTPAANSLWGVSSLSGNLALGLKRRSLADQLIGAELSHGSDRVPGLRLIDFISLKYLTVGHLFANPGFVEVYSDTELQVRIMDNTYAYPRFQFFTDANFVATMGEAVDAIAALESRTLILEGTPTPDSPVTVDEAATDPTYRLVKDQSDHYVFEIDAPASAWFFVADANYPGWNAYLDGIQVPLFSAQLLGKAVFVPAGNHVLSMVFEPNSVRLGLVITMVSLGCVLLLFGKLVYNRVSSR